MSNGTNLSPAARRIHLHLPKTTVANAIKKHAERHGLAGNSLAVFSRKVDDHIEPIVDAMAELLAGLPPSASHESAPSAASPAAASTDPKKA